MSGLKILVVGTGRCGTGFLANSLEKSGFDCGHEAIFNHWDEDSVRMRYAASSLSAEASWAAAPFLDSGWFGPSVKVIHLARNPLAVIKSFHDINFFSAARVDKHLNQAVYRNSSIRPESQDRLVSAVTHYYEWNALISQALQRRTGQSIVVKLEDLTVGGSGVDPLSSFIGTEFIRANEVINPKTGEKAENEAPFDKEAAFSLMIAASKLHGDFGYTV